MAHYYLYDNATGTLISDSAAPITSGANRSVLQAESKYDLRAYEWDTSTKSFILKPAKKIVTTHELVTEILTDQEFEGWANSAHVKAKAAFEKLRWLSFVDLKSSRAETIFNGLEALGILAAGRSEEIRNG